MSHPKKVISFCQTLAFTAGAVLGLPTSGCQDNPSKPCGYAFETRAKGQRADIEVYNSAHGSVDIEHIEAYYQDEPQEIEHNVNSTVWQLVDAVPRRTYTFVITTCGKEFEVEQEYLGGCAGPSFVLILSDLECPPAGFR